MGANIIHVGAVGAGEVAKLCNNLISGSALIAVAEAFRIGEAFGVDPLNPDQCQILRRHLGDGATCTRSPGSSTAPLRAGNTRPAS